MTPLLSSNTSVLLTSTSDWMTYSQIFISPKKKYYEHCPFTDVLIFHAISGWLTKKICRKCTNTDRVLPFVSKHPVTLNTLHQVVVQAYHREIFQSKGWRRGSWKLYVIHQKRDLNKLHTLLLKPQYPKILEWPTNKWHSGMHINIVSEAAASLLAHKPTNTLRAKLREPKGPLNKMEQSVVIYIIKCMNFQANYVLEQERN